ncbi:MAG: ABC transporter substrate-binding protein [Thermoguttaceae bacterium]
MSPLWTQELPPIFKTLPFNKITVKAAHGGGTFDIFPVSFPDRKRPNPLPKSGELIVRFTVYPADEYAIFWSAVERITLFEEIVLQELQDRQKKVIEQLRSSSAEKEELVEEMKRSFEDLYEYYVFLFDAEFRPEGMLDLFKQFLSGEALFYIQCKDWITAQSRLETLYAEQKDYPGLSENMGRVLDERIRTFTTSKDYYTARKFIQLLDQHFPQHPVAVKWADRYIEQVRKIITESEQALSKNDFALAAQKCLLGQEIYPDLPELKEQIAKIYKLCPYVSIGVTNPIVPQLLQPNAQLEAARRNEMQLLFVARNVLPGLLRGERLLSRPLFEEIGFAAEGGMYASSYGTLQKDMSSQKEGMTLRFQFGENLFGPAQKPLELVRIAQTILNDRLPFLTSLEMDGFDQLLFHFKADQLLPESHLRIPVLAPEVKDGVSRLSPFIASTTTSFAEQICFRRNEQSLFSQKEQGGPQLIIEQTISSTREGLTLLEQGKIVILDRIAPWEIPSDYVNVNRYFVASYAVPSVQMLIPNRNKPLTANRTFRRALLYGLDRQRMMNQFGGKPGDVQLSSGPAPRGFSETDPLGYGYDTAIVPRAYDPKLAVALVLLTLAQLRDQGLLLERDTPARIGFKTISQDMPELVIAYPDNSAALTACLAIQRNWERLGIPVRLQSMTEKEEIGRGNEVDFWYVSCSLGEPLIDVPQILSGDGFSGKATSYMSFAIEKLNRATTWPEVAQRMYAIHRLCYEETAVLPLWEWRDCTIIRKVIRNVLDRGEPSPDPNPLPRNELLNLYQNVNRWEFENLYLEN